MPIRRLRINKLLACLFVFLLPLASFAQGGAGVFPPMVEPGHQSFEYRAAVDPDNRADEVGFVQRLHYQASINTDFMWRIIGQTRKTIDTDFDFDFVQAELFWDLGEDNQNYRTGLRFDIRLRENDRANQVGLNWMSQYNFDENWHARAVLMASFEAGENAVDGITMQTRWQLAKGLESGQMLGVELYNNYGNMGDNRGFGEQNHSIGPIFVTPLAADWSVFSSALFGISDGAADAEFKFWLTKKI